MGEGSFYGSLLRMVLSLVIVFGALFALRYYVMRKMPSGAAKVNSSLHIRERLVLGPRSQALILDVATKSYLVCIAEHAISVTPLDPLPQHDDSQGVGHPPFGSQLKDALTLLKGRD